MKKYPIILITGRRKEKNEKNFFVVELMMILVSI